MFKSFIRRAGVLVAASVLTAAAHAGVVTTGTVYNNTGGEYSGYVVSGMTTQSGLSTGYVSGVTDFATYIAGGVTHVTFASPGTTWLSTSPTPSFPIFLDFDLGSTLNVLQLALWNGTGGNDAAVNGLSVFTSNSADFSVQTAAGAFSNPLGSGGLEPATVFDLIDSSARYVRVRIDSYYGNGCCVGIGEVAFDSTAPGGTVSLPGTLALVGLGFAALGVSSRRRA